MSEFVDRYFLDNLMETLKKKLTIETRMEVAAYTAELCIEDGESSTAVYHLSRLIVLMNAKIMKDHC